MKTVGVVIPIYNVEKYLKECLDSVINQTYTNLEIILVNDGSTDESSLNIAKEYTLKDKRITLFDKKNGGLSSARNVGIEYFSGEYKLNNRTQDIKENSLIEFDIEGRNSYEIHSVYKSCKAFKNKQELTNFTYPDIDYIIFLDSDDYWELNCIEECVPRMDGVEVVWFDWVYKHEISEYFCDETYQDLYGFKSGIISSTEWASKYSNVGRKWFIFAWHGMIDFRYLKSIKLKFVDNAIHEDICFGTLLFMYSKFIYVLRKKIYKYRIRENSICDRNENNNRAWINPYFRKAYLYFGSNVKKTKKYHKLYSVILSTCYLVEFINNNKKENSLDYSSIIRDRIDALWSALNSLTHDPLEAYKKIPKVLYKDRINEIIQDYEYKINILKYGSAKSRIQNQLSYKLGQVLIFNSKNILGILFLPIYLISTVIVYKQEKKIYLKKIKKDPSLVLPCIEDYPDYHEAISIKNHLSYRLGQILIRDCKMWYKGGLFKLPFDIMKEYKHMKIN